MVVSYEVENPSADNHLNGLVSFEKPAGVVPGFLESQLGGGRFFRNLKNAVEVNWEVPEWLFFFSGCNETGLES